MNFLGKGIDAIDVNSLHIDYENKNENFSQKVPVNQISIGKYQPRKKGSISNASIQEMVDSIKKHGVLQPIIVRILPNEHYELIAGERRYLAAIETGLNEIPCIIKNVTEKDALAIALIENIQREQLSLLEESESILKLKEEHSLSVDDVAKLISKPRTTVANLVRVASLLSREGKVLLEENKIDFGHVRAVLTLEHQFQNTILQYVATHRLSVRETEKIIREGRYNELNIELKIKNTYAISDELTKIKHKYSAIFNKNIQLKALNSGKIKVSIEFENIAKVNEYLRSVSID